MIHLLSIEPDLDRAVSAAAAEAWLPHTCFKHGPPRRIGVELEFHLLPAPDRARHELLNELLAVVSPGPDAGRITLEPGGQLELSSAPASSLNRLLDRTTRDLSRLAAIAGRHAVRMVGLGLLPAGDPALLLDHPRYTAMVRYLEQWAPSGRLMMLSTAAIQINVEAGRLGRGGADIAHRWQLLHDVAPALIAAFANSPLVNGRRSGWKSTRQAVWAAIDPGRTLGPVVAPGADPRPEWTRWALDAPLLLVRREAGPWTAPPGVTFRDWIAGGRRIVPDRPAPTLDDLDYHLSTLFPPVRARGHLEVRYLDALPGGWWRVPVAVLDALLLDDAAAQVALQACEPVRNRRRDAARLGLADPVIARAATSVLDVAARALTRRSDARDQVRWVEDYIERWTARGRCPADDLVDPSGAGRVEGSW